MTHTNGTAARVTELEPDVGTIIDRHAGRCGGDRGATLGYLVRLADNVIAAVDPAPTSTRTIPLWASEWPNAKAPEKAPKRQPRQRPENQYRREERNITVYEHPGATRPAFRVKVARGGHKVVKTIRFSDYGSREEALKAARQVRDALEAAIPKPKRGER